MTKRMDRLRAALAKQRFEAAGKSASVFTDGLNGQQGQTRFHFLHGMSAQRGRFIHAKQRRKAYARGASLVTTPQNPLPDHAQYRIGRAHQSARKRAQKQKLVNAAQHKVRLTTL